MARQPTRQLSRWFVNRFPATSRRPARAVVALHGHEYRGLVRSWVSERYTVPLPPQAVTNEQLVAAAMRLSPHKWAAAAYVFGDIRKALKRPSVLTAPQALPDDPDDAAAAQTPVLPSSAALPVIPPPGPDRAIGASIGAPTRVPVLSPAERAARRAAFVADHAERMRTLTSAAVWLHTSVGVATLSVVDLVALLLAFVVDVPVLLLALAVALCVVDWHNTVTLHGQIDWATLRATSRWGFWVAAVGMVLFGWIALPSIYAVQAWQVMPALRAQRHETTRARIAELEAELLPTPATPTTPATDDAR